MNDFEFAKKLYADKDYDSLSAFFHSDKEKLAKIFLFQKKFKESLVLYKELEMPFETGYCYLLSGNLKKAEEIWNNIFDENPYLIWGRTLIDLLNENYSNPPAFMHLRNFLEVDMEYFFAVKHFDFISKIIKAADFLAEINWETYKYIGRVLLNNSYTNDALVYFEKFKDVCFNDPENHYLIAKCQMKLNNVQAARKAIRNCLKVAPDYYPALSFFSRDENL